MRGREGGREEGKGGREGGREGRRETEKWNATVVKYCHVPTICAEKALYVQSLWYLDRGLQLAPRKGREPF